MSLLKILLKAAVVVVIGFTGIACTSPAPESVTEPAPSTPTSSTKKNSAAQMELHSPAFENEHHLPSRFTCVGEGSSPPLEVEKVPRGTKSVVIIVEDPDAPGSTFTHWLMWNWPVAEIGIPGAISPKPKRDNGAVQGTASNGKIGYAPPCPPGGIHRYYFKAYALDTMLDLPSSAGRKELDAAMQGHILAQSELMATYQKP